LVMCTSCTSALFGTPAISYSLVCRPPAQHRNPCCHRWTSNQHRLPSFCNTMAAVASSSACFSIWIRPSVFASTPSLTRAPFRVTNIKSLPPGASLLTTLAQPLGCFATPLTSGLPIAMHYFHFPSATYSLLDILQHASSFHLIFISVGGVRGWGPKAKHSIWVWRARPDLNWSPGGVSIFRWCLCLSGLHFHGV
jgi:hypothetical protein